MTEKIDFGKTAGRLCVEDCCPCCGGPCYDGCDLCEDKERAATEGEPSCCTGRCCTCFPGLNLEGMEEGDPGVPKGRDLEASFFLENCSNTDCNGYLGSILLRGSRKAIPEDATGMLPAGCDFDDIDEGERALDALCIRKTDAGGTFIPTNNSQDCTKQICGQKSREGLPEVGGVPIYEIWSGFGLICEPDEQAKGDSSITDSCEYDKDWECGGEMVELSVCCCQGNNKDEENRLLQVQTWLIEALHLHAPPPLRFINELLSLNTQEEAIEMIKTQANELDKDILDIMQSVVDQLQSDQQAELAAKLQDYIPLVRIELEKL